MDEEKRELGDSESSAAEVSADAPVSTESDGGSEVVVTEESVSGEVIDSQGDSQVEAVEDIRGFAVC